MNGDVRITLGVMAVCVAANRSPEQFDKEVVEPVQFDKTIPRQPIPNMPGHV